jgi:endonuclease/exonuclease/phosphatase family metal-dependent hydrolase
MSWRNAAMKAIDRTHLFVLLLVLVCLATFLSGADFTIRVMTYNIRHGEGVDGQLDLQRIADLITSQQADLVAVQEVDKGVARTAGRDLPAELAALTGLHYFFEKNIDHQGGEYGNLILSRYPIEQRLNRHYRMLREGEQRGLLQIVVSARGQRLVFMATHIDHRSDDSERLVNVDEICEAADLHASQPVIVAGDFNDRPGSRVHSKMKRQFCDAWEVVGRGDGFTFSADRPRSRIDYVWLSNHSSLKPVAAWVVASEASDHLPLVVECRVDVP